VPYSQLITTFSPERMALLKTRVYMNPPEPGFDPLDADDATLVRHRLPPRPARTARVAETNWVRALSGKPEFVGSVASFEGGPRSLTRAGGSSDFPHESSRNWSGSYVRPLDFSKMALVQSRWTVPEPKNPKPGTHGIYASSIWVGLDGRDPTSRSLPQIGTGQYFVDTIIPGPPSPKPIVGPVVFAWWQWWDRDDPNSQQVTLQQFLPVSIGDSIYAQVQIMLPGVVEESPGPIASLFTKNEATNMAFAAYVIPPTPLYPPPAYDSVEARTADWILERPAVPSQPVPTYFGFADFTAMTFVDRNAAIQAGPILEDIELDRGRLIRMNAWDDPDLPGREVSTPTLLGEDVKLSYVPSP
jgi:hypothetical protein